MPAKPGASPVRKGVFKAGRLFVMLAALGLTYGAFFLAAMRVASRAREVAVPDLRGQTISDATATLAPLGLGIRVDEARRPDPKIPANHILSQEPDPGAVLRRQRSVRVRLSDGQKDPVVPNVVGSPERSAEGTLAAEHVAIGGRAEIRAAEYGAGVVVAQSPPPSQRASSITLLVNRRDDNETFVMPDLIGTLADRSIALLRAQNFRVTVGAEVPYPGLPVGIVIKQSPLPGYRVTSVQAITVEVSK
jgi:beta-lactam-binding protein with PASTA domain